MKELDRQTDADLTGRLRHRITVRREANVKTGTGGLTRTWTTVVADLPAEVLSMNGREALVGQTLQSISHYQITVRFRDDLKTSDQVLWNGRELNIHSADDRTGLRRATVIYASTLAPQGA